MERAVVLCPQEILRLADLPAPLRVLGGEETPTLLSFELFTPLREVERRMIEETLKACGGDRVRAATLLGITARTIYRREAEWRGEPEEAG